MQVQTMTGPSFGHYPTGNVPFMFEQGQTLWIYLRLQIAGTKAMQPNSWALRSDLKFSFPFSSPSICNNV